MAVTLTQWREKIRRRADLYDSDHMVDDATDLDAIINESMRNAWDFLVEAFGDEFFSVPCTLTLAALQWYSGLGAISGLNAAAPTWKILRVDFADSNGTRYPMERLNLANAILDTTNSAQWVPGQVSYALRWDQIIFQPIPQTQQTVNIQAIPKPNTLTLGTDTLANTLNSVSSINPLEEFAELPITYAAIKLITKQERDPTALMAQLEDIRQHILRRSGRLDRQPRTIVNRQRLSDVKGRSRGVA